MRRPTVGGLAMALVFWWQSLSPTMLPRSWVAQAVVTGVCAAVGYAVGTLIHDVVLRLGRRANRQPSERVRWAAPRVLAVAAAVVLVTGAVVWPRWQNEQRDLLLTAHVSAAAAVPMMLVAALVAVLVGLIGRLVWSGVRAIDRWISRWLPRAASVAITALVVVLIANYLVTDVAINRLHSWANSAWGVLEDDIDHSVPPPTSPATSGSPESLVRWEDLGRQGRAFVSEATPLDALAAFHEGADVVEPVRAYVGLRSADTAAERARLAVEELERAGGFEREVLVVATVSGTGWVDPFAAMAVEQLWAGDTAIVTMQYSFLPSWISTLVDGDAARQAGSTLFDAVYQRWSDIPGADRPTLLVFGQSLGSYGAEAAFAGIDSRSSVANLVARTDGALFSGPTNDNVVWRQLTAARDPESPAWRPAYDGGRTVRFVNGASEPAEPDARWEAPRVLYIQHPSDPVVFWDMATMWRPPEWLGDPTGADISGRASWFPFVTWAQGLADLSAGFSAGPGFGHDYSHSFVAGWAALAAPDGWTVEDTRRLESHLGW